METADNYEIEVNAKRCAELTNLLVYENFLRVSDIPKLCLGVYDDKDNLKLQEFVVKWIIDKKLTKGLHLDLYMSRSELAFVAFINGKTDAQNLSDEFYESTVEKVITTLPLYFYDNIYENNAPIVNSNGTMVNFKSNKSEIVAHHIYEINELSEFNQLKILYNFSITSKILLHYVDVYILLDEIYFWNKKK